MKSIQIEQASSIAAHSSKVRDAIALTRGMFAESALLQNRARKWPDISLDAYQGVAFQILESVSRTGVKKTWRMISGEVQNGSVFAEVILDSAKSVASGYITSSIGKGVGVTAEAAGLSGITKINAHLAIAVGIVQSSKSLIAYLDNRIDAEQMLDEISQAAVNGTAAFYYGAVGQTVIAVPVAGALIGSTVGYFVGNMLYQSGLLSLGEPASVKHSQKRRQRVEEICLYAIPLMQQHREDLQKTVEEYHIGQTTCFETAFKAMDSAFAEWDPDIYISQLETICSALHVGLPFTSFKKFDLFMHDSTNIFEL